MVASRYLKGGCELRLFALAVSEFYPSLLIVACGRIFLNHHGVVEGGGCRRIRHGSQRVKHTGRAASHADLNSALSPHAPRPMTSGAVG